MSTSAATEDDDLLLQFAEGNERAYDALYHRYSKKVYAFALRASALPDSAS